MDLLQRYRDFHAYCLKMGNHHPDSLVSCYTALREVKCLHSVSLHAAGLVDDMSIALKFHVRDLPKDRIDAIPPSPARKALDYMDAAKRGGWEGDGGQKFDQDKPRMDLLDGYAMDELAKVLTFGAKKYAPHNWRKGITFSRLLAASARHLFAIMRGENKDEETGLDHAAHLMCCAMFLVWTAKYKPDMDDRYGKVPLAEDFKGGCNHD